MQRVRICNGLDFVVLIVTLTAVSALKVLLMSEEDCDIIREHSAIRNAVKLLPSADPELLAELFKFFALLAINGGGA